MFNDVKAGIGTGMRAGFAALALGCSLAARCGSGSNTNSGGNAAVTLTLASNSVVVPQDGLAATVAVTVSGAPAGSSVTVSGLPAGITETFKANAGSASGVVAFTGSTTVAAGNYPATVSVTVNGQFTTQNLTVISAPVAKLTGIADAAQGVNGHFEQFMSTSFQIFQYTGDIFGSGSTATQREQELTNLQPQHIRLQAIGAAIPMVSNTGTAADWDFSLLDKTVQPVLASADQSPEFQIASAPGWMCDSSGHLEVAAHAQDFADYAANLVCYYNKGGFDVGSTHFQQPGTTHITWWGIFNEPNLVGMPPADYVTLYDTSRRWRCAARTARCAS